MIHGDMDSSAENGENKLQVQQQPMKKISVPFVEDRRRSVTTRQGHNGRAILCAVDASTHSRDAFECELNNFISFILRLSKLN